VAAWTIEALLVAHHIVAWVGPLVHWKTRVLIAVNCWAVRDFYALKQFTTWHNIWEGGIMIACAGISA